MYSSHLNRDFGIEYAGDILTRVLINTAERAGKNAGDLYVNDPAIIFRPYLGTLSEGERLHVARIAEAHGMSTMILIEGANTHTVKVTMPGDYPDGGQAAAALDDASSGLRDIFDYLDSLWDEFDWSVVFEMDEDVYEESAA